jgi:F-box-like
MEIMLLLQDLPPEVLKLIASYLDQGSLAAMTCMCKRINDSCISILYKVVVLDDMKCWHFYRSIEQRPELAAYVQSITFDHREYFADHYADSLLPKLPRVRHLRVFAREQGFFDRGMDEDENALGLGLSWPGPCERAPSSVRAAASSIASWLPDLKTCKS